MKIEGKSVIKDVEKVREARKYYYYYKLQCLYEFYIDKELTKEEYERAVERLDFMYDEIIRGFRKND